MNDARFYVAAWTWSDLVTVRSTKRDTTQRIASGTLVTTALGFDRNS